jgi:hypothetical protein
MKLTEWEIKKETDEQYFSNYGLDIDQPENSIVTASLLKDIFNRGLYDVLLEPFEPDEATKKNFEIGSALHKYILEKSDFENVYHFGLENPAKDTIAIGISVQDYLERIRKECELKYPELIDEVGAEVTITGELEGVKVKAKMDKFFLKGSRAYVYDLKSIGLPIKKIKKTPDGRAWEIGRVINDYHYDLQMYFYGLLVENWLRQQGIYADVVTVLVFASKQDYGVKGFMLSPETIARGEEKFRNAFNQVKDFITGGVENIDRFEII